MTIKAGLTVYIINTIIYNEIMSPLRTKGDILFKSDFFLPLLLSEACPDHNFFVFRDRSMIFRMWVHDHKAVWRTVMTFVGPLPLTSRSDNCYLNSIFLSGP